MIPRRRSRSLIAGGAVLIALALQLLGANPAVSQSSELTVWWAKEDPGLDPGAAVWRQIPPLEIPLSAQGMTYPLQGTVSIPTLHARAVLHERVLYVRVDWRDPTRDDATARAEQFADAVALQFPATADVSVPSVCMGQADSGVNIWQWRADSERGVDPMVAEAFPRAVADFAPTTAALAYPARAVGNPYASVDAGPVQSLVATGFGTLGPAREQAVKGRGAWQGDGWAVVFARPFAAPGPDQPSFRIGQQTDLALAVWNGSQGDRNGKKAVSSFVRLALWGTSLTPPRADQHGIPPVIWFLAGAPLAALFVFGCALAVRRLGVRR